MGLRPRVAQIPLDRLVSTRLCEPTTQELIRSGRRKRCLMAIRGAAPTRSILAWSMAKAMAAALSTASIWVPVGGWSCRARASVYKIARRLFVLGSRTPQRAGPQQTSLPDDYPRDDSARWRIACEVWGDGWLYAAAGSFPSIEQSGRFWHGTAAGTGYAALAVGGRQPWYGRQEEGGLG